MESIVNYGSDEENDNDHNYHPVMKCAGRREDDTNYDDVNMDMSEDSNKYASSSSSLSSGERRAQGSRSRSSESPSKSRNTSPYKRERKSADLDKNHQDKSSGRRDRDKELKSCKSERHSPNRRRVKHSPKRKRDQQSPYRRPSNQSSEKKGYSHSSELRHERQSSDRRPDRKSSERRPDLSSSERRPDRYSSEPKYDRQSSERSPQRKSPESRRDSQSSECRLERKSLDRRRDRHSSERRSERPSSEQKAARRDRKRSSGSDSSRHKESRPEEFDSLTKVPALMDLKPFGGEPPPQPPVAGGLGQPNSQERREKSSTRDREHKDRSEGKDRDRHRDDRSRRDKERERRDTDKRTSRDKDRERNRDRHSDKKSSRDNHSRTNDRNARTEVRKFTGKAHTSPPPAPMSTDYRHSYKVNKKLQVMEKMGLQIKTPDGSMATVQQLVQRNLPTAAPGVPGLPAYYNPNAVNAAKIVDQVQKRKLLWGHKDAPAPAAQWTGTKFAQDTDGKQASKFMRLMGIKDGHASVQAPPERASAASDVRVNADVGADADVIRKQEEMFQHMQEQYEVARVTTHTMRGVGLGFSQQFPRQF